LQALDLDGQEYLVSSDGYAARMFQHEIDHLDGVLTIDRVDPDTRKAALRHIREHGLQAAVPGQDPVPL
jgi:peptide deformylase